MNPSWSALLPDRVVDMTTFACLQCAKRLLRIRLSRSDTPTGPAPDLSSLQAVLESEAVWTTGADEALLADPCLDRLAGTLRLPISSLSLSIAEAVRARTGEICHHAICVGEHVCTTLTYCSANSDLVGLINVADLLVEPAGEQRLARAMLPVPTDLLEAQPDEPTLSIKEMNELSDWQPRTCEDLRQPRRWEHLIFVSHRWGAPERPKTRWTDIKKKVNEWVDAQLALAPEKRGPRMKAATADAFGVWVDYMIVPNKGHTDREGNPCPKCQNQKARMIQRINALLTLATVLPMDESARYRGWILQELTLDKHGATKYEHRDRVSLMADQVEFADATKDSSTDDGLLLRCNEFVRLGQTPRVWPAVNQQLLTQLREAGHQDEGSPEAWATLTGLARAFNKDCHLLKKLMAELSQDVALARSARSRTNSGTREAPIDLRPLCRGIAEQGDAMKALAEAIAADSRPALNAAATTFIESGDELLSALPQALGQKLAPGWATFRKAIRDLPDGVTDPSLALLQCSVGERQRLTARLQWQQFVGVGMGLRAEWLRNAGLGAWVRLSVITEALGGVKFMARLKDGRVRFSEATSVTLLPEIRPLAAQIDLARRVVREGIAGAEMEALYRFGEAAKKEQEKIQRRDDEVVQ